MEARCHQAGFASRPENEEALLLTNNEARRLFDPRRSRAKNEAMAVMKNKLHLALGRKLLFGMDALRIVMPQSPEAFNKLAQPRVRMKLSIVHSRAQD
jgi:hypothetical protein